MVHIRRSFGLALLLSLLLCSARSVSADDLYVTGGSFGETDFDFGTYGFMGESELVAKVHYMRGVNEQSAFSAKVYVIIENTGPKTVTVNLTETLGFGGENNYWGMLGIGEEVTVDIGALAYGDNLSSPWLCEIRLEDPSWSGTPNQKQCRIRVELLMSGARDPYASKGWLYVDGEYGYSMVGDSWIYMPGSSTTYTFDYLVRLWSLFNTRSGWQYLNYPDVYGLALDRWYYVDEATPFYCYNYYESRWFRMGR